MEGEVEKIVGEILWRPYVPLGTRGHSSSNSNTDKDNCMRFLWFERCIPGIDRAKIST